MCRWVAYSGRPIYLEDALFKPENSLIAQSRSARWTTSVTNADGFGLGWYGSRDQPGLFRDVLPAWNDDNLRSVSAQIRSRLFFAHVRASTGAAVSRMNCHPFRHGKWLFMHNGLIGGFDRIRHLLDPHIDPAYYPARAGTTDSETFFYLLLSHGAHDDPPAAFARTIALVVRVMAAAGIEDGFKMAAALTDGEQIFAIRYSSDGNSPSLFYGNAAFGDAGETDGATTLILSEPLDMDAGNWIPVAEAQMLVAGDGAIATTAFAPAA